MKKHETLKLLLHVCKTWKTWSWESPLWFLVFFLFIYSSFHFEKGTLLERESCELRFYPIAVLSLTTLMSTIAIKPVVHPTSDLPKYVKRYILMMSASPYEDLSMSCHLRQSLRFNEWTTTLNEGSKTPDSVTEMLDVIQTYLWSTRARIEAEWLGAKLHRRLDIPMCKVHGETGGTFQMVPLIINPLYTLYGGCWVRSVRTISPFKCA